MHPRQFGVDDHLIFPVMLWPFGLLILVTFYKPLDNKLKEWKWKKQPPQKLS